MRLPTIASDHSEGIRPLARSLRQAVGDVYAGFGWAGHSPEILAYLLHDE